MDLSQMLTAVAGWVAISVPTALLIGALMAGSKPHGMRLVIRASDRR